MKYLGQPNRSQPRTGIDLLLAALIHALRNGDLEDDQEWLVSFFREVGRLPEGTVVLREPCPRDTNGDGDCGQRGCPDCGGGPVDERRRRHDALTASFALLFGGGPQADDPPDDVVDDPTYRMDPIVPGRE